MTSTELIRLIVGARVLVAAAALAACGGAVAQAARDAAELQDREPPQAEIGEEDIQRADLERDPLDPDAVGAVAACAVCHGLEGEGDPQLDAPRIGGLAAWYLARQLEYLHAGIRGGTDEDKYGTQMRAMTLLLDGGENVEEELGRYIASLDPPEAPTTIMGDVARGEELYMVCSACHGEDGRGSEELNTPSMIGQHDWYLVRQLEHFKSGLRGSHEADIFGAQMAAIMSALPDEQAIIDVVAYINTL